jgi:hypothetical protein
MVRTRINVGRQDAATKRCRDLPQAVNGKGMMDSAEKRGAIIKHLEDALALADELNEGSTGFLIERALDEARARHFRLIRDDGNT